MLKEFKEYYESWKKGEMSVGEEMTSIEEKELCKSDKKILKMRFFLYQKVEFVKQI